MKNNCLKCKFYDKTYKECHRYPPKTKFDSSGYSSNHYPYVKKEDWCGKFKK